MKGSMLLLQLSLQSAVVVLLLLAIADAQRSNCNEKCGGIPISYPFGLTDGCYLPIYGQDDQPFKIGCNSTNSRLQFSNFTSFPYNLTNISFEESTLHLMLNSSRDCYSDKDASVRIPEMYSQWSELYLPPSYSVSDLNYVVVIGCSKIAQFNGQRQVPDPEKPPLIFSGVASCNDDLGSKFTKNCNGFGCAVSPIPVSMNRFSVGIWTVGYGILSTAFWLNDYRCNYAFVVDQHNFTWAGNETFDQLKSTGEELPVLPVLINWKIGNDNCTVAKKNETVYACKAANSECLDRDGGYYCRCESGYEGNPYLLDGCKDFNECSNKTFCGANSECKNLIGNYICECHKGFIPVENDRRNCMKGGGTSSRPMKIALGVCLGFLVVVLIAFWIYRGIKLRKLERLKLRYFRNNGGDKLRKMMEGSKGPPPVKIFSHEELKLATKNFNHREKIGEGAYGCVYKGTLPDKSVVAIKVPKAKDPLKGGSQTDQFANELMILSRITHKNVVRLLGCCLETEMPILVYEYINNGTVFEHIHKPKGKQEPLSFQLRLKIAKETAASLVYLHYNNDPQIVHRDVKTSNILVDDKFTAKVSDFGASKFVSEDQNPQATCLQGTPGYLDPEYLRSNILTAKSDVYSFGVVLVELITSEAAVTNTKPEEERNLANHFITKMKENRLPEIIDPDIIKDGSYEVAEKVAVLALKCLSLKGSERPDMTEVWSEIEEIWQFAPNRFTSAMGRPDASPKETDTLLSMASPSDSYQGVPSIDYDKSLPDDPSLIKPVNGGR